MTYSVLDDLIQENIVTGENIIPYIVDDEVQAKVYDGSTFRQELIDSFTTSDQITGAKLPWGSTHFNIRFRTGETTIWAGINGHGKSQLLGMASIGWIAQGESVLNISLEMKPLATLKRMAVQAAMNDQPTEMILNQFMDFMLCSGYIFNHQGNVEPRLIFGAIRYASSKGIKHVIIDSLMKCVKGVDDYNAQKDFVNQITQLAQQYNVHIHLVHHIRKQENEEKVPNKFDLAGSGAITDLADQVIIVFRNKLKERALDRDPANQDALAMPDAVLSVDKNRHGEWEGRIPLWFNSTCKQYLSNSNRRPLDLMDKATYEFNQRGL
jgi:twinkle protein